MHFQRIVQQNNENENVASIKQCFIVGKILLQSQPPRKSAQQQLPGREGSLSTEAILSR